MPVVNSANIVNILNELIANAGNNVELTSGCPYGYLNSLSFLDGFAPCDDFLRFSNTLGNQTNASFYIDYAGFVTGILNLLKFQITSSFIIPTNSGGGPSLDTGTFTSSFTGSYNLGSDFICTLYASGSITTYLPQIILDEVQSGGSLQCNPNSSEGVCPSDCVCGVVAGLGTTSSNEVTWTPNSLTLNKKNFATIGTVTLVDATINGILSCTISTIKPSIPPYVDNATFNISNPDLPLVFYIYGASIKKVRLNYTDYTTDFEIFPGVSNLNIPLNTNEVNVLLAKIMYDIDEQVNAYLQYQIYTVINTP